MSQDCCEGDRKNLVFITRRKEPISREDLGSIKQAWRVLWQSASLLQPLLWDYGLHGPHLLRA